MTPKHTIARTPFSAPAACWRARRADTTGISNAPGTRITLAFRAPARLNSVLAARAMASTECALDSDGTIGNLSLDFYFLFRIAVNMLQSVIEIKADDP